jgi:tetratricopeptide (TPR) repeat protein
MLDREYARQPLDSGTSWSLMTYSYLSGLLANQVTAPSRAAALWAAPLAAARAIAFDPADAVRWIRLSETLTELGCNRAAAVLSSQAGRLAPDDQGVRRNRIATLFNLGDIEPALALIGQATPEPGDGWYSAVRAVALQVSARGLFGPAEASALEESRHAADEAVRIEPQNLWYHRARADIRWRSGQPDLAIEDFDYLWRHSQLDQADGLSYASRAAVELGLGADAVALSEQALILAAATVEDCGDYFDRGAAFILQDKQEGVADLEAAVALVWTSVNIEYLRIRLDRLAFLIRRAGIGIDLTGITRAIDARAAQIEAGDDKPLQLLIQRELDRVAGNPHYPADVAAVASLAASLTRTWCGLALGDSSCLVVLAELAGRYPEYPELSSAAKTLAASPLPGLDQPAGTPAAAGSPAAAAAAPATTATAPAAVAAAPAAAAAPDARILEANVPRTWFAGLAEPLDHEIIKRYVPDARARLQRSTGEMLPGVIFRDDTRLEPAGFRVLVRGTVVDSGQLKADRWYCPADQRAALSPQIRAQLTPADEAAVPDSGAAPGTWTGKVRRLLTAMTGPPGSPPRRQGAAAPDQPAFPALESFPVPEHPDPLTALVAWPPAEVVARRIERAYSATEAAQGSAGGGQAAVPLPNTVGPGIGRASGGDGNG